MPSLNKKYKYAAVIIIIVILWSIFPHIFPAINFAGIVNAAGPDYFADSDENQPTQSVKTEGKTQIKSVIPYVKKDDDVEQTVPVESGDDISKYTNSVSLKIQVYLNSEDATRYYGKTLYIFKLKPYKEITDVANGEPAANFSVNSQESFTYDVSLFADFSDLNNGEIYNKFVAAAKVGDSYVPLTDARYISNINCLSNKRYVPPVSKTKKGLSTIQMLGEASLLGVGYATVKMALNDFMSPEPTANTEAYVFGGENFYFNIDKISEYDKKIKYLTNEGINVTAVLIISADEYLQANQSSSVSSVSSENTESVENPEANKIAPVNPVEYLIHPNALASSQSSVKPFYYGINSTNENGFKYFAALMSFIAERYVKENSGYGRIYNIILGGEIGRSTMYNNCGQIDIVQYVKDYLRAVRICDTAIRSRFGGSRVYIPFDNWFASKPDGDGDFINKEIIDLLSEYSIKEGNFIWNVAYHAYNENRLSPEVWKETAPTDSYDTPVITMKNIKVLCDYLNLDKRDYLPNGEPRKIMLSDQGFSSGDNSKENMDAQAAAFVYAYLKAKYIPDITAFIYHGQVDNTNEIGSFGLWTNDPDTVNEPGTQKTIYDVFKYMDTDKEAEKIAFAKSILGIKNFTEIVPLYSESTEPATVLQEVAGKSLKTKPSARNIGLFNKAGLSGFMGSANISDMSVVEYINEKSGYNGRNMLFAGFSSPKKGDFGGIYKIYTSDDPIENLKNEKYVGVKLRIDTSLNLPEDYKIRLILILEGEADIAGISATSGETPSAGTIALTGAGTAGAAKTLNIYEGVANITPNEDATVYFDISQWDGKANIKKVKLLVNPYSPYSSSNTPDNSDNINNNTNADLNISNISGISETGRNYDFKLYVFSIIAAHNSTMSAIQNFMTVTVIIILILAGAYAVLYIRARIVRERRRKERELMKKRRVRAAAARTKALQNRLPPPANRPQLPLPNASRNNVSRPNNAKNTSNFRTGTDINRRINNVHPNIPSKNNGNKNKNSYNNY